MTKTIEALFDRFRPHFEEGGRFGWAWPIYEGAETPVLTPDTRTSSGAHIRDRMDMKRLMIFVLYAMVPCIFMGWYNVGYQAYLAEGMATPGLVDCLVRGGWNMFPIIVVSYVVGGAAEVLFCVVRSHEINEGFLVTAMLYPLTLPPTIPLWMVAMGIIFGVVIGKEVFGGVGMNVLNPALTARAFVFFTYPAQISGARIWDAGGKDMFGDPSAIVDGYTGATPLLAVASAERGPNAVAALEAAGWSFNDLALGLIPGSMGEVSAVGALIGAVLLVIWGLASWRTMVGCVLGVLAMGGLFNALAGPESLALFHLPAHYHLVMGGFAFGTVFMATDPVSSSSTNTGRWIYGFSIGALCALVRVVNPAYPEGMMLAILFMNVFAPLIDYFVIRRTTRRRVARLAAAAGGDMAGFTNAYTFGFATAVCIVCSLAVSSVSLGLRDLQEANKRRDTQSNILKALGLPEDGSPLKGERIDALWAERVQVRLIDPAGAFVDDASRDLTGDGQLNQADADVARAQVKGSEKTPGLLSVYVRQDGQKVGAIAVPMHGAGLWGPISGYLALEPTATKVTGATFFAPKETPGLGAEITGDKFKKLWVGKRVTDDGGATKPIRVVKGSAELLCRGETAWCVDGVSGATITSRGVDDMVAQALGWYDPYLKQIRGR